MALQQFILSRSDVAIRRPRRQQGSCLSYAVATVVCVCVYFGSMFKGMFCGSLGIACWFGIMGEKREGATWENVVSGDRFEEVNVFFC